MKSVAQHHYPPVVWRDGRKKLWNLIRRRALKNRPEERVRLRIIDFLLAAGWSKHRISTEEAIGGRGERDLRTDIVCYDQQFNPRILVECKAEYVPVTEQTAEQTARYNRRINAPYLLMTNGVQDYWYRIYSEEQVIRQLEQIPDLLDHPAAADRGAPDFSYWQERGFAGTSSGTELRRWLTAVNRDFWMNEDPASVRFLEFDKRTSDLELSHYYRIVPLGDSRRLALTLMNTPYGGSRLVAVLNKHSANVSVTEINLDLLFDNREANTVIYSAGGAQTCDIRTQWDPANPEQQPASAKAVASMIERLLDRHRNTAS